MALKRKAIKGPTEKSLSAYSRFPRQFQPSNRSESYRSESSSSMWLSCSKASAVRDFLHILYGEFRAHHNLQFPLRHEVCCRGPMRSAALPLFPEFCPSGPSSAHRPPPPNWKCLCATNQPTKPGGILLNCSLGTGETNRTSGQVFKQTLAAFQPPPAAPHLPPPIPPPEASRWGGARDGGRQTAPGTRVPPAALRGGEREGRRQGDTYGDGPGPARISPPVPAPLFRLECLPPRPSKRGGEGGRVRVRINTFPLSILIPLPHFLTHQQWTFITHEALMP